MGVWNQLPSTAQGFLLESNGTLKTSTSFDLKTTKVLIKSGFVHELKINPWKGISSQQLIYLKTLTGTAPKIIWTLMMMATDFLIQSRLPTVPTRTKLLANAAPDSLELNGSTLLENAPIGTQVGELIATDRF